MNRRRPRERRREGGVVRDNLLTWHSQQISLLLVDLLVPERMILQLLSNVDRAYPAERARTMYHESDGEMPRRTSKSIKARIWQLLASPETRRWSDRRIAKIVGVAPSTAIRHRRAYEAIHPDSSQGSERICLRMGQVQRMDVSALKNRRTKGSLAEGTAPRCNDPALTQAKQSIEDALDSVSKATDGFDPLRILAFCSAVKRLAQEFISGPAD